MISALVKASGLGNPVMGEGPNVSPADTSKEKK